MCIISGPVHTVSATRIFVCPSRDGLRQLTVYENAVDTPTENMMCLPVPNPASVVFETVPDDLMSHCAWSIQQDRSRGRDMLSWGGEEPLTIISHGSYEVVLVPSMHAFDRVPNGFAVSADVVHFLQAEYPETMGVLLCRLKPGNTTYTPFAYSHTLQREGQLFVPTKHYHVHSVKPDVAMGRALASVDTVHADWDHEIYSYMTTPRAHDAQGRLPMPHNRIPWNRMPAGFGWSPEKPLHLLRRVGDWPNMDVVLTLAMA